jgi:hypothetical protein
MILLYSAAEARHLEQVATSCRAAGWIEKTADPRTFLARFAQLVAKRGEPRGRQKSPAHAG